MVVRQGGGVHFAFPYDGSHIWLLSLVPGVWRDVAALKEEIRALDKKERAFDFTANQDSHCALLMPQLANQKAAFIAFPPTPWSALIFYWSAEKGDILPVAKHL